MKRNGRVKQAIVTKGVWKATESPVDAYLDFLMDPQEADTPEVVRTSLPPDQAERVVLFLLRSNGHRVSHRGFMRRVKEAIKAGHQGLDKYLPGYVAPVEDEGPLEFVLAAD
jgi:hypothetical protein